MKMYLEMSSGKWRPLCLDPNVLAIEYTNRYLVFKWVVLFVTKLSVTYPACNAIYEVTITLHPHPRTHTHEYQMSSRVYQGLSVSSAFYAENPPPQKRRVWSLLFWTLQKQNVFIYNIRTIRFIYMMMPLLWKQKRIPHYWVFVVEYTGHQYISPREKQDISCFVVVRLNKLLKSRFVVSQWVETIWCSWHHCNIISYPNGVDLVLTLPFVTIWQSNLHCNCMFPSENWYVFSE